MKRFLVYIVYLAFFLCQVCAQQNNIIDLSGSWLVILDSKEYSVKLPGTLAENKVGIAVKDSAVGRLSEEFHYEGKAIYLKNIEIPDEWDNKPIFMKFFMKN